MLSENTKKDIQELSAIMLQLDNAGRMIMMSNAAVLLARQELNDEAAGEKAAGTDMTGTRKGREDGGRNRKFNAGAGGEIL